MIKLVNVPNVAQTNSAEDQVGILNLVVCMMDKTDRRKKVAEYSTSVVGSKGGEGTGNVTVKVEDGVAGFEVYLTNKHVRSDDQKELVESREFYPCGLTDSDEIIQYINWNTYTQCFKMLQVLLEVDDPTINLPAALEARAKEEAEKAQEA